MPAARSSTVFAPQPSCRPPKPPPAPHLPPTQNPTHYKPFRQEHSKFRKATNQIDEPKTAPPANLPPSGWDPFKHLVPPGNAPATFPRPPTNERTNLVSASKNPGEHPYRPPPSRVGHSAAVSRRPPRLGPRSGGSPIAPVPPTSPALSGVRLRPDRRLYHRRLRLPFLCARPPQLIGPMPRSQSQIFARRNGNRQLDEHQRPTRKNTMNPGNPSHCHRARKAPHRSPNALRRPV